MVISVISYRTDLNMNNKQKPLANASGFAYYRIGVMNYAIKARNEKRHIL